MTYHSMLRVGEGEDTSLQHLQVEEGIVVNFLSNSYLYSSLSLEKDTWHHPELEEGGAASCEWGRTHSSFLRGEGDTSQHLKCGGRWGRKHHKILMF